MDSRHRDAVGLEGCAFGAAPGLGTDVELTTADVRTRSFPTRLSPTLGICAKQGRVHEPVAEGRTVPIPADAVILRPPGTIWSSPHARVGFVCIDIAPSLLPDGADYERMTSRPATALPAIAVLARALAGGGTVFQQQERVAALISALFDVQFARGGVALSGEPVVARRAREYLESHHAQNPTLDDVAMFAGSNRFALLRLFRRTYGITPHAFQIQVQVHRARQLLMSGVSTSEVAALVGFSDQSHLGRHFRRITGMPPRQYQRLARTSLAVPA